MWLIRVDFAVRLGKNPGRAGLFNWLLNFSALFIAVEWE